jgi:hypothetical protein
MELGKCKDLAGALIATGLVNHRMRIIAIAESCGLIFEMFIDGVNHVSELDGLWRLFNSGDEFVYNHIRIRII